MDDATATTALFLLISVFRQFSFAERLVRQLKWKPKDSVDTHDPTGKTLAILGLGGIGTRLAVLAHAFPMRIIYYSRRRNPRAPEYCEYFDNVEEMLKQADVLSVHVPLREETVGLVGEKWIRTLKPGAIIINTARGKIVDEDALIRALEDGHVRCSTERCDCGLTVLFFFASSVVPVWMSSLMNRRSIHACWTFQTSRSYRTWALRPLTRRRRWKSAR